jgi:hypothetical protein
MFSLSRRVFFIRTAVASGIVGLSALGLNFFRESESVAPTGIVAEIGSDFATLDSRFASFGRPKIEQLVAHGNETQSSRALMWIQERGHASMYDLICHALADKRKEVAFLAYGILQAMDPQSLRPNLGLLQTVLTNIRWVKLQGHASQLVTTIESS